MRIGAIGLFAVTSAIWGSTWLAITYQLTGVSPEVSVAYRFALAAALLAVWCVATRRSLRFSRKDHAYLAAVGVTMFGLNYVGIYWAERLITSGLVAVLFSTIVFLNPIGMRVFFGTTLTARTFVAAAMGVAGVALLFLPELVEAPGGGVAAYGIAFAVGATVIASGGNLIAQRNQRAGIPTLAGNAWGMAYGAVVAAVAALVQGAEWTFDPRPGYVVSLAYLAVFGSVVAFGAYLTLLRRIGAARAAYTAVATPVIALALSTLFEGYRWTWAGALGVALAIAGIALALRPARKAEWAAATGGRRFSSRRD
ncbi:MAG TPA: DMT family transporter [Casimicrobiaceae bacterium]|nr:DMT family transporter [Casimicrobiaceae bacterium]